MTLLVMSALTLGIGLNSAVFSVINSVLLHPLSIERPDRLVFVRSRSAQASPATLSYPEYLDLKQESRCLEDMALYQFFIFNFSSDGPPEQLDGLKVTASAFHTLGVHPAIGRSFMASDDVPGAGGVAVISHGLWQRRFGGDPSIVGKTIVLHAQPYTIVGVFPRTDFPFIKDVWVDIGPSLNDKRIMNRESRYFYAVGRMAPGIKTTQAQSEMNAIAARLEAQYPESNKGIGVGVVAALEQFTSTVRRPLLLIATASGLILLLASINVLIVFIATAVERGKELSIRLALGATRAILRRQIVVQALMFSIFGASLGLLAAKLALAYIIRESPVPIFHFAETTVDGRVFWFTALLAIGSTLLSSTLPCLYVARLNINRGLKGERVWSASRYRLFGQATLIILEVAFAASLTVVSGLLIKSFYEVQKVDLGFDPHRIVSFMVWLPEARYTSGAAKVAFYRRALENLRAIPGVQSASAGYSLPAVTGTRFINLQVDADSPLKTERPFVDANSVMPGFFSSMRIAMLQGRDFNEQDRSDTPPVAIVDEVLAQRLWPGQRPLGKRLRLADITDSRPPWREVVGVVRQIKYFGPEGRVDRLQAYEPVTQDPPPFICFVLHSGESLATLKPAAERAIHSVAPDLPLDYFQKLEVFLDQKEGGRTISVFLLSGFAIIGIALGMIGIYGVVSNAVAQRRREVAVRMALGATAKSTMFLVARFGLLATLAGIALGSTIAISLTGVLSAFLFGVKPLDPATYILSAFGIAGLALLACLVPSAALLRVDPKSILRD